MAKNLCDTCGNSINCMMQSGIVRTECSMYRSSKNDLADDCISRKAVIEITAETGALETQSRVKALPPVTSQEPRKGYWINKDHSFESCSAECSSCHKRSNGYMHDNGFSLECKYYNFCPNCGSDNRKVEE